MRELLYGGICNEPQQRILNLLGRPVLSLCRIPEGSGKCPWDAENIARGVPSMCLPVAHRAEALGLASSLAL